MLFKLIKSVLKLNAWEEALIGFKIGRIVENKKRVFILKLRLAFKAKEWTITEVVDIMRSG